MASKADWEKAAHLEGLELVHHECPECCGEGVVEVQVGLCDFERERCEACEGGLLCPVTGDRHAEDEMAWTVVDGRVVSVVSVIGCAVCGEHPRALGSDLCAHCLDGAATVRSVEQVWGVAS